MRHKEKEVTDPAAIEDILAAALVCRLAMFDGAYPYIVPMNFGYRDNTLYFHTGPEGRKIGALRACARVGFEVDVDVAMLPAGTACKWSVRYRSVVGRGTARIVEDREEKRAAYDILMAHYTDEGPHEYRDESLDKSVIVAVDVESMTGRASG